MRYDVYFVNKVWCSKGVVVFFVESLGSWEKGYLIFIVLLFYRMLFFDEGE